MTGFVVSGYAAWGRPAGAAVAKGRQRLHLARHLRARMYSACDPSDIFKRQTSLRGRRLYPAWSRLSCLTHLIA
ncbi:hypothetical protein BQ8794_170074 [Mesorhizobium prunaredense]|uniref:Uncharacterized protein n=1 Tax=Mesorhizobium prunaredense TaxID=1631249 RepID=A0A1R3V3V8_9HYPH|nr:hypothetical protein BQ8794_170074 [Mesorhizobium prunaredense]